MGPGYGAVEFHDLESKSLGESGSFKVGVKKERAGRRQEKAFACVHDKHLLKKKRERKI